MVGLARGMRACLGGEGRGGKGGACGMGGFMQDYRVGDVIVALASGAGQAGVAVVRLSGPGCRALVGQWLFPKLLQLPVREVGWGKVRLGDGEVLDEALGVWFAAPGSFTGEEVVELFTHGGRAVVTSPTKNLRCWGCRRWRRRAARCWRNGPRRWLSGRESACARGCGWP